MDSMTAKTADIGGADERNQVFVVGGFGAFYERHGIGGTDRFDQFGSGERRPIPEFGRTLSRSLVGLITDAGPAPGRST
jgi:hypothetical protein